MTFAGPSGFKQKKRSQEFQKTTQKMKVVKRGHKCAVCGRTDKDSPGMEFRYCSKCEGNYEYCMDHLYTHKHVKKRMQILVITTNRIGMLCALKPYIPICPETFIPVSGT